MSCDHDERFKSVFFATNGCLACELEQAHNQLASLNARLRSVEDQLIEVANFAGARCGDGMPTQSGDTLAAAIIRKLKNKNFMET